MSLLLVALRGGFLPVPVAAGFGGGFVATTVSLLGETLESLMCLLDGGDICSLSGDESLGAARFWLVR